MKEAQQKPAIDDRCAGAFVGALIGDALALGPHWYYDLDEQKREYGPWIDDYTDPKSDRYHAGLQAGDQSQAGYLMLLMARSIIACGKYDQDDFCARLDNELFPQLDGSLSKEPGGYTSQSIRETCTRRVKQRKSWDDVAGEADSTEALERAIPLAIHHAQEPRLLGPAYHSEYGAYTMQRTGSVDDRCVFIGACIAVARP